MIGANSPWDLEWDVEERRYHSDFVEFADRLPGPAYVPIRIAEAVEDHPEMLQAMLAVVEHAYHAARQDERRREFATRTLDTFLTWCRGGMSHTCALQSLASDWDRMKAPLPTGASLPFAVSVASATATDTVSG